MRTAVCQVMSTIADAGRRQRLQAWADSQVLQVAEDLPVGFQPTLSIATAIKPPSFYQQPSQAQQAQQQAVSSSGAGAMAQPEPVARGQAQNSVSTGITQSESGAAGSNGATASRAFRKSRNSSWQQADPGMEEMRRLLSPWRYVPWWQSVHISSRSQWLVGLIPFCSRSQA